MANTDRQELVLTAEMPELPIIRLIKADEASVFSHWGLVREKLLRLKRKFKIRVPHVPLRWEPEHFRFEILKNIRGGFAQSNIELFWALGRDETEQETIDGFFITTLEYDSFAHIPLEFLIWVACTWKPLVLESSFLQVPEIAKARGCTRIKHMSPFLGWKKRQEMMNSHIARIYGKEMPQWRPNYVIWAMDLYEDK